LNFELFKHQVEGDGDVYPLSTVGQQWGYYLVVALAARKYLSIAYDGHHLRGKIGFGVVCDTDDDEFHRMLGI
jgi:hypothetical protein